MPAFIQNSTAIAINNKNIIDGKSSYDRIDSFFEKIKYVLDNCFNDVDPQLLNFTINANGDVDVDTDYLDLLPAKDNKMINELHKAMKNRFINAIEKDIWYEGPDNYTNFDEVSSEEDSPYESPIFTSDDLYSIGLNFESSYDFDDLAPLCKKALEYLEDEYSIELVDYQGTYEYFESGKNNFDEIRESDGEWDKAYIEKLIKENDYENGSKDGDELILKIAAHPNTNPTFLEDFVLSGAHPIIVALHVVKNSSVDSDLLNQTWEENEKWWKNDEISSTILGHPNCPESLKQDIMEKKYTILSDTAAPERDISTHTFEEFIELCSFRESLLKDWFKEYRYDAEVEQGEDYYHESIIQEIEYPDGSTNKIDIPVVLADTTAHSFDDAVEHELKTLKDGEIIIQGEMEWTGGKWNSYSIELDESEKFEPNKIQAEGNLGMVVDYTYDGTSFENNEDRNLTDGYINLSVYLKLDDEIHELDLDKLENSLEKNSLKIDSSNSDEILSHFKKYFKDKEDVENKAEEIVTDGPHKTFYKGEGLEGILYEEGFLKNSQWDGLYKSYHSKGELQLEGNYKEGVRVGRWKKYSHTTPYIKNQGFKGGLYNDFRYKDKYEVDELKTLVDEGLEGLLHGPFIQYFYNRNIEFEGSYKNNKKDGLFKEYSFQGELESEQNYKEGEVVD